MRRPCSRSVVLAHTAEPTLTVVGSRAMALSIPLVWADDHRLHEPAAEIWVGVRTPAAELPARADAIRDDAARGRGRSWWRPTPHDDAVARGGPRPRPARVPRRRLGRLGGGRAARGPGPGPRRAVHLPAPRPDGRARAAGAGGHVGATGRVLLRHDDADRSRHLGGGARSSRRRAHGGRPRRGRRTARLRLLPPAWTSRHAHRLRRLVLPQQRRASRRSGSASSARPASPSSTSTRITATGPSRSSGSAATSSPAPCTSIPRRAGSRTSSAALPSAVAGAGQGANLNVPLPPGAGDADWLRAVAEIGQAARSHGAEALVARARRRCGGRRPREPARR